MRRNTTAVALLLVILLSVVAESSESKLQSRTKESIAGLWKGKSEELPPVDIALKVEGGILTGTATFYYVETTGDGAAVKRTAESELIEPSFDGSILVIKVKRKDGSYFQANMKFIADNKAELTPVSDGKVSDLWFIPLFRDK